MDSRVDLIADLNAHGDDGRGWSTIAEARGPRPVQPGAVLVAGSEQARSLVRVVELDAYGQVHFEIL